MERDFDQSAMTHALPRAAIVDRIDYLCDLARGRRVVHVGFVDRGCQDVHEREGTWLHERLAASAAELVGVDIDERGVKEARERGYEAYAVDCRDPEAIRALGLAPFDLVLAGEVIEHLDQPGPFLDGLHAFTGDASTSARPALLVCTTPNASGILNGIAALAGYEVNHPDHVVMYSWRTLQTMLGRHGWNVVETRLFVPRVTSPRPTGLKERILADGARAVLWLERTLGRLGAPYVADGLIVVARPGSPD
jgi:rhodanese-related sulfurtransferase